MTNIQSRLDQIENKLKDIDSFSDRLSAAEISIEELTTENNVLQLRINELEDQSRRNNLIFHGIPDAKEPWKETESKLNTLLADAHISLPSNAIERAHRLGTYSPNKCRPVIAKFASFKTKELILSKRKHFKESDISISEDYSSGTRIARKKLIEFGKNYSGSPDFQLRYTKLHLNRKIYIYNAASDSIEQLPSSSRSSGPNDDTLPRTSP